MNDLARYIADLRKRVASRNRPRSAAFAVSKRILRPGLSWCNKKNDSLRVGSRGSQSGFSAFPKIARTQAERRNSSCLTVYSRAKSQRTEGHEGQQDVKTSPSYLSVRT